MITHTLSNKDANIFEFDISQEIDLLEVKQIVSNYRNNFKVSRVSSASGWHSSYFTHLKDTSFQPLVQLIERKMNAEVSPIICSPSFVSAIWTVLESWALVYDRFTYVEEHSHHNLCYSSVCYISAENCSSIHFNDYEIVPSTGKLLFFPGFLKHRVAAMLPKHGERIAFACNLYPEFDLTSIESSRKRSLEDQTGQL